MWRPARAGPKLVLDYGPADHKGFDSVYPTIVRDGKPVLLTDWSFLSKVVSNAHSAAGSGGSR